MKKRETIPNTIKVEIELPVDLWADFSMMVEQQRDACETLRTGIKNAPECGTDHSINAQVAEALMKAVLTAKLLDAMRYASDKLGIPGFRID